MKRRSGFTVMARLIGLVKPLTGYMILAITMGLIGHLSRSLAVMQCWMSCGLIRDFLFG